MLRAIRSWITEGKMPLKVRGTLDEVRIVGEVAEASRALHLEVNGDDASLVKINELLSRKCAVAKEFERTFGFKYPF